MNGIKRSVLQVLAYYDMFQYPLSMKEIHAFMGVRCPFAELEKCIEDLLEDKKIFESNRFYSVQNLDIISTKRIKENAAAEKQLKLAKKIACFLTWFPYIRGVAISGSLSKQVANEESDIDFFVITKENRLWIAKIFFRLMIKLSSFIRLDKWFCINYIIDETSLEVSEKNIFTATEIITLLPVYGLTSFDRFIEVNEWVYKYFPNHGFFINDAKEVKRNFVKKTIEFFFDGKRGDKADSAILNYFARRWKKLMSKNRFKKSGFQIGAMMADKHSCRPYPEDFQGKILQLYEQKLKSLHLEAPMIHSISYSFS